MVLREFQRCSGLPPLSTAISFASAVARAVETVDESGRRYSTRGDGPRARAERDPPFSRTATRRDPFEIRGFQPIYPLPGSVALSCGKTNPHRPESRIALFRRTRISILRRLIYMRLHPLSYYRASRRKCINLSSLSLSLFLSQHIKSNYIFVESVYAFYCARIVRIV